MAERVIVCLGGIMDQKAIALSTSPRRNAELAGLRTQQQASTNLCSLEMAGWVEGLPARVPGHSRAHAR